MVEFDFYELMQWSDYNQFEGDWDYCGSAGNEEDAKEWVSRSYDRKYVGKNFYKPKNTELL